MKEDLKWVSKMDLVYINGKINLAILVIGLKMQCMEKENSFGLIYDNIKVNGRIIR